jgi:hypothetical protein
MSVVGFSPSINDSSIYPQASTSTPVLTPHTQAKMLAYERTVADLNHARLRGTSFPIIHSLIQAALSVPSDVRGVFHLSGKYVILVFYSLHQPKPPSLCTFSQKSPPSLRRCLPSSILEHTSSTPPYLSANLHEPTSLLPPLRRPLLYGRRSLVVRGRRSKSSTGTSSSALCCRDRLRLNWEATQARRIGFVHSSC